jgi:hypothetical protein
MSPVVNSGARASIRRRFGLILVGFAVVIEASAATATATAAA